jgi:anaerobic selenocysteine-containing dehydrogenase
LDKSDVEIKYSNCYFCTSRGCAMKVYVEGDRVQKVRFDRSAPVNPGGFCVRPVLAKEYQEHPFRLSYPLKRKGERGADSWERISWEQALDEIAQRLEAIRRQYGAEALATSSGTGRGAWDFAKGRFMNLFGSPNRFGAVTVCFGPRSMVSFSTYGGSLVPDRRPGKTRLNVLWGREPHEGASIRGTPSRSRYGTAPGRWCVDPRLTEPARIADVWVPLRPGTGAPLALGMMHIMIAEGWYDRAFVEAHTIGFPNWPRG